MKNIFATICTIVTLAGCAPTVWSKPGADRQTYNQDSYQCEKDTRQSGYFGGGITGALAMKEFFDRCMIAHGYIKQEHGAYPANATAHPVDQNYSEALKKAQGHCAKILPKKKMGDPAYNRCVSNAIDGDPE